MSFAGAMREHNLLYRRSGTRDALGAPADDWIEIGHVWATVRPVERAPGFVADARATTLTVRVMLRRCDIRVGDRMARTSGHVDVTEVIDDPAFPDRIVAIGELAR